MTLKLRHSFWFTLACPLLFLVCGCSEPPTSTSTEMGASTQPDAAQQQSANSTLETNDSGVSIDVGEQGVDVEVGDSVDVELDSEDGVKVDVGNKTQTEADPAG